MTTTKEDVANKSTDGTLASNSDIKYPSEKATKTYVDATATGNTTALTAEVTRATSAEDILTTNLATEITNRTAGETAITADLNLKVNIADTAAMLSPYITAADAKIYLVRDVADEITATAAQTTFTLSQAPSVNSKVKMYINGIRISNTAYSVSGTLLTYLPANNGSYVLSVSDRIQYDYFY